MTQNGPMALTVRRQEREPNDKPYKWTIPEGCSCLSLNWKDIGSSFGSVARHVLNIVDKLYYIRGIAVANLFGYKAAKPGLSRSYGVEATFWF